MHVRLLVHHLIGLAVFLHTADSKRDERGLSQSAENAILLAGAVGIAIAVIVAIKSYVLAHLPK